VFVRGVSAAEIRIACLLRDRIGHPVEYIELLTLRRLSPVPQQDRQVEE